MKIRLLFILFLIIAHGCATVVGGFKKFYDLHPNLKREVVEFKKEIGLKGHRYPALTGGYSDLAPSHLGTCYTFIDGSVEIEISSNLSPLNAPEKAVIWHELAHCLCGVKHAKARWEDGCPSSIMSAEAGPAHCYYKNWKKYVEDIRFRCYKKIVE
jgi:hypothetical protein